MAILRLFGNFEKMIIGTLTTLPDYAAKIFLMCVCVVANAGSAFLLPKQTKFGKSSANHYVVRRALSFDWGCYILPSQI